MNQQDTKQSQPVWCNIRARGRIEKPLGWLAALVLTAAFVLGSSSILSGLTGSRMFPAFEQRPWFVAGFTYNLIEYPFLKRAAGR